MRNWTEDFGSFMTDSGDCGSRKRIYIITRHDMTGEDMVRVALMLAQKYNVEITGRVEYTHDGQAGGGVSFMVECSSRTYRYFYEGGRMSKPRSPRISEKDIAAYEETFGTRKCTDDHMGKNRYYFKDNWDGNILSFPSLKKAKEAAMKQTGKTCCIYEIQPYGRCSEIVCIAPASGHVPS